MELDDKRQFLSQCPPFSSLESECLDLCMKHLEIAFFKVGTRLDTEQLGDGLYLLRTGSVELKGEAGVFHDRLSSGECFSFSVFCSSDSESGDSDSCSGMQQVITLEDSLVFCFPHKLILQLMARNQDFSVFFDRKKAVCLQPPLDKHNRDFRLNQSVESLMISAPLCTPQSARIDEAAARMSSARVSSILVVDDERLTGILTDRDLRSRVLAKGVDPSGPVSSVMTENPRTIAREQTVYEAQLLMMTGNIHHLPVVEMDEGGGKRPLGIITLNDFIRAQNSEPVYLIQAINRARKRDDLYAAARQLPELICKMIRANVKAAEVGRIITSITDSMTRKLIALATQSLGEAPCAYAWVVFGSQARQDQMLGSDQDNGLILARDVDDTERGYFRQFAEFVNTGLDKSGLKFCPGGIMAMTEKWCQALPVWQQYFTRWIREPEPKALMHASIFYDIRHVVGDRELTDALRELVLHEAQKNTIFQACMTENALQSSPPLGFFKTFVLEKDGNHNPVLDLKHRGTVPIVALVRLYCLANGIEAVNTEDRLKALRDASILSAAECGNLMDAHEFIATLRLDSQSQAATSGGEVSNNLNPDSLSPLVRHQLKDAFSVVAESQRHLKMRFGHGAI